MRFILISQVLYEVLFDVVAIIFLLLFHPSDILNNMIILKAFVLYISPLLKELKPRQ